MMPFRFVCTFGTDMSNVTFRHPSSQQRVPVLLISRGSVCAGAEGSVRAVRIQLHFKRFSHHSSPLFCLSARLGVWGRRDSARHTEKSSSSNIRNHLWDSCTSSLWPPPPVRVLNAMETLHGRHDDAKTKSPGRKRGCGAAGRASVLQVRTIHSWKTFPSVRYKQIHKNTTWPAFTSTEIHKDQLSHYDSVPTTC